MELAFYSIIGVAIAVMIYGMGLALRLRRVASGGTIGRVVNILIGFVAVFLAGYLAAPVVAHVPAEYSLLLMALVFLFGAVFVVIVLWLMIRLVRQVLQSLEMG